MRSIHLAIATTLVLIALLTLPTSGMAAQDSGSPVAVDGPNDLSLPGIDSQLLGTGTASTSLSGMPRMILERISLSAGSTLPAHTATGPELLVVESGTPGITDSFGFTGQIAPNGTFFDSGAQYTLSNPGTEPASALRLSTGEGTDPALASPIAADATVTILIDSPLDDPRLSEPTLTIAKLTWHPGTEPQTLDHDAAIGLLVLDGTLFAKSPSGFDGQLAPNTPVVFPANTPLAAHADDDGPASALIVSIIDGATPIVSARQPTPTPVPTATPTLVPSITPIPTQTLVPTETHTPTMTSIPTSTPLPTPIPTTPPNSLLQLGETWKSSTIWVTLTANDAGHCPCAPGVDIGMSITNVTNERLDIDLSSFGLRLYDDNRFNWPANMSNSFPSSQRLILEPKESKEFGATAYADGAGGEWRSYSANVFVVLEGLGSLERGRWGFTYDGGQVLTIPPDAIDPTTTGVVEGDQTSGGTNLQSASLPANATLPSSINSLVLSEQGTRGQYEIISTFPNPSEADALFTQWGWSGSNYEVFVAPNGATGADGLYEVDIGIHQLAGPAEAVEALKYFMDARAYLLGLWEANVNPIGNMSKALVGPSDDGGYEASVYVVVGSQVIRVTALSWNDYPLDAAISIMRQVIGA